MRSDKKSVIERRNDFPSLSLGDQPLNKESEDSGYEIFSGGRMGIHPLDKVVQSAVQPNGPSRTTLNRTIIICVLNFSFSVLWKALITRYGGRATEALDVSSLAKITDGYTPGHMAQAIQQILTERRIQQVLFLTLCQLGIPQSRINILFYIKSHFMMGKKLHSSLNPT